MLVMMRNELLTLAEKVMAVKGWKPGQLERKFGSPKLLETIATGKNGPTIGVAERFKGWLEAQLSEEAA